MTVPSLYENKNLKVGSMSFFLSEENHMIIYIYIHYIIKYVNFLLKRKWNDVGKEGSSV